MVIQAYTRWLRGGDCGFAKNYFMVKAWQVASHPCDVGSKCNGAETCWVRRLGNSVAHVAAKLALNSYLDFCFNKGNRPPSLEVACKGDSSVCVV
uniref:Uncharacterized protein n=1 Tax=Quercus lobata TaxID=97700 RepID=A0A7N2RD21_QUELO